MAETPREPDRFSVQACAVVETWNAGASGLSDLIAAALRREHDAALDEAAREAEALSSNYDKDRAEIADSIADAIRALASPAAAPAAECPEPPPGWETITTGPTAGCGNIATYREPAPAQRAEKRIEELERALELAYPYVIEGDEGTEVDGLFHAQIVARINKVMRASKPPGAGEGT